MVWKLITVKVALSVIASSSNGNLQSPTWPTGGSTRPTFGTHTPLLAPLISAEDVHDLHGDVPALLVTAIPSLALSAHASNSNGISVIAEPLR